MLYLVDKPLADVAFRTAAADDDALVVLIQDGVLLDPASDAPDLDPDIRTYAVAKDADVRGVDLPEGVERVDYDRVLELILDHEVKSFV